MRYPDSGGLSARGRVQRERVRLEAADMFVHQVAAVEIAARLRVSTKSVYQWRRRWAAGGVAALASRGRFEDAVAGAGAATIAQHLLGKSISPS
jgi:transposase-like protein